MKPDKIKPEHNPWYLLATLHGEALSADDAVHERNRNTWNRFMASELTEDARELLIKEGRCSAEDLIPFSPEELAEVEKLFAERHRQLNSDASTAGAAPPIPNLKSDRIDFSDVQFDSPFCAKGFFFPIQTDVKFDQRGLGPAPSGLADFSGTTFSGQANFSGATFFGQALFSDATFSRREDFSGATFFVWANFTGTTFYWPDFRDATFLGQAHFRKAIFHGGADFAGTTFSEWADFGGTTFSGRADFSGATFFDRADFQRTSFSGSAYFSDTTFSGSASFSEATFSSWAVFSGASKPIPSATFSDWADFSGAKFFRRADLSGTTFKKETLFVNVEMGGPTSFENAVFSTAPPQFFGAKLHEGTVWRGVPPWPLPPDQKAAGPFVDAYERLKLEMDRLKKHEDELDFFALELQSRRVLHGDWQQVRLLEIPEKTVTPRPRKLFGRSFTLPSFTIKARTLRLFRPAPGLAIALYGWLSDYGRSYVRPFSWLLATVLAGVLPFWWHLAGFWQAAGLSLANTFGVFGFRRELIGSDVLAALPGLLKVLAGAQTVAGVVLLFLVGLAIRNRFRMK